MIGYLQGWRYWPGCPGEDAAVGAAGHVQAGRCAGLVRRSRRRRRRRRRDRAEPALGRPGRGAGDGQGGRSDRDGCLRARFVDLAQGLDQLSLPFALALLSRLSPAGVPGAQLPGAERDKERCARQPDQDVDEARRPHDAAKLLRMRIEHREHRAVGVEHLGQRHPHGRKGGECPRERFNPDDRKDHHQNRERDRLKRAIAPEGNHQSHGATG